MKLPVLFAALALSSTAAFAGISSPQISRSQVIQQATVFDSHLVDLGISLMGNQKLWSDSVRQQFDTVRMGTLSLDELLERPDTSAQDIQVRFQALNTAFSSFRQGISPNTGIFGSDAANSLSASIDAFNMLQTDISSVQ